MAASLALTPIRAADRWWAIRPADQNVDFAWLGNRLLADGFSGGGGDATRYNAGLLEHIFQHRLGNGLWLLAEPVPGAQSLAMSWLLPAGASAEPQGQQGVAALLAEMICRGAGPLDARAHSDALDRLGVQRGTGVESIHLRVGAAMIGSKLAEALPLLTDMVRRPMLAAGTLEPSREPRSAVPGFAGRRTPAQGFHHLASAPLPSAIRALAAGTQGRPGSGHHRSGSLLIGGGLLCPPIPSLDLRGNLTGRPCAIRWNPCWAIGPAVLRNPRNKPPRRAATTMSRPNPPKSTLPWPYDVLPEPHPQSILQKAAVAVLSGGMSSRLFTEVREKRGLCYAVGARYSGDKTRGAVLAYSGTTAPRAQETLDVLAAGTAPPESGY